MRRAAVAAVFIASAFPVHAQEDLRAQSVAECMAFADLALVASTMAKHGITRAKADTMLPDIYQLEGRQVKEIAGRIVDTAYAVGTRRTVEPREFASKIGKNCIASQGRLDGMLGRTL